MSFGEFVQSLWQLDKIDDQRDQAMISMSLRSNQDPGQFNSESNNNMVSSYFGGSDLQCYVAYRSISERVGTP